jgi:two-component system cell cycle response regulator
MSSLFDKDFAPGTRILVADDDLVTRMMLTATLNEWGLEVTEAEDGQGALDILASDDPPRLALMDWNMPGKSGLQVCRELRAKAPEPYIYVIILTSMSKTEDVVEGLGSGADDYVMKPYNPGELRVRLKAGDRIVRLQTELIDAREALRDQANRDPMTGLLNRRAIQRKFRDQCADGTATGTPLTALLIDIDHFKLINDTHGHDVGDQVIIELGRRIREVVGAKGQVSRYGGEEFLVIFPACDRETAKQYISDLHLAIRSTPLQAKNGIAVSMTASMGFSSDILKSDDKIEDYVKAADEALYDAKRNGRDRFIFQALKRSDKQEV